MSESAARILEQAISSGKSRGLRWADLFVKNGSTCIVSLLPDGSVNWTRTAEGGIALRVFLADGATGFVSSTGPAPDDATVRYLVDAALDAARPTRPERPDDSGPIGPVSGEGGDGRGLGIFDTRLHTATPGDLEGILDDAAAEALRADPRVHRLESASIAASSSEVTLLNTAGFTGSYRQTLVHLSLGVVAGDAAGSVVVRRSRTARQLAAFSAALFGDETARLAATSLAGRPPREGVFPAVLAPPAAAELLRCFTRTLSLPGPGTGTVVASRRLTVIDDGRLPGGCATAPFDGEGVPTRRTPIVSRGEFEEMIHDLASAAATHGAASTGNGVRASFRDPPRRSPSNRFITPGGDDPSDLLRELGRMGGGLWVQAIRPTPAVSGDDTIFSVLVTGRWIGDDGPGAPVSGALVSWPVADLLHGVLGAGNDLTFGFMSGSYGAPSLLVRQVGVRAS